MFRRQLLRRQRILRDVFASATHAAPLVACVRSPPTLRPPPPSSAVHSNAARQGTALACKRPQKTTDATRRWMPVACAEGDRLEQGCALAKLATSGCPGCRSSGRRRRVRSPCPAKRPSSPGLAHSSHRAAPAGVGTTGRHGRRPHRRNNAHVARVHSTPAPLHRSRLLRSR